jgi:hypothetical protein
VDIIIVVTMVVGSLVLWGITPRRKKKLHIMNNARKRPRE